MWGKTNLFVIASTAFVLTPNAFMGNPIPYEKRKDDYIEKKKSIDSIEHEVKQLNSQIKSKSDLLLQTYHLDHLRVHCKE